MRMRWPAVCLVWMLLWVAQATHAEDIIMTRSVLSFPEAMLVLQESISAHGYTVSRVQRIDVGLTGMGYQTDKYRIVFAGKLDEIRTLTERAPQLIPYLPPKIAIFSEGEQTVLVTINPGVYAEIAAGAVEPVLFKRWESDLRSIFHDVNSAR